jgi:aminomethyltransferase
MTLTLARTPLSDWHATHSGRMVDFAGWLMPVQYASIVAEHLATRTAVGLFDVSHMGRIFFRGSDAEAFLDRLITRRAAGMQPGQVRYGLVTNESGGILDDILVYRRPDNLSADSPYQQFSHWLVVNASNREKIIDWIRERQGSSDVDYDDRTLETAMIAVQGPRSAEVLVPVLGDEILAMKYYTGRAVSAFGEELLVSRTGYTGEDGWEVVVAASRALELWEQLANRSAPLGGGPAGLGCRDTLRLEAAMPLYGHELNEKITPLDAGLDFAVNLDGHDFPGAAALRRQKVAGVQQVRIGLELAGRRPAREGCSVLRNGSPIGRITSGTFSPTLDRPIAMAYVDSDQSAIGTAVQIDIRGNLEPATIVKLPFYRRTT